MVHRLGSRESGMRNVQWSIKIQNQIFAPPKQDGYVGLFAMPLSFQSDENIWEELDYIQCYANVSIISRILHSNISPKAISHKDRKCIQRPLLRKTDDLRRKNLYRHSAQLQEGYWLCKTVTNYVLFEVYNHYWAITE